MKDVQWLVTPPKDKMFTLALKDACRGREEIANLLNYFLYEASREAEKRGIDKNAVEYIEIKRTLDDIISGLNKHNKGASKKTIHDRIVILTSWLFLQAFGYLHTYRIYFKNIQMSIDVPPPVEKSKPRGRHARKADGNFHSKVPSSIPSLHEVEECVNLRGEKSNLPSEVYHELTSRVEQLEEEVHTLQSALQAALQRIEDGNFHSKVPSSIPPLHEIEECVNLREGKLNLPSQMLDLTSEKLDLTSQMLNLTSELAHEKACRKALEAKIAALYSNNTDNRYNSNTDTKGVALSSCQSEEGNFDLNGKSALWRAELTSQVEQLQKQVSTLLTSKKKKSQAVSQLSLPEPTPNLSGLSELERKVYDKMRREDQPKYLSWSSKQRSVLNNWLVVRRFPPVSIGNALEDAVRQLADEEPTPEDYNEVEKYVHAKEKTSTRKFYNGRSLKLWDFVREWAEWKSTKQVQSDNAPPEEKAPEVVPKDDDQILWTMNPGYPGRAIEDWHNFRMMTVREAREKYQYGQVTLNWHRVDQHDIRARLINAGYIPRKERVIAIT